MERLTARTSSVLLILFFLSVCAKHDSFPVLKGPYLGQEPPGDEPQLFLPGLISTNYFDQCIAFLDGGRVCVFSIREKGTYYMYEKDGQWTRPKNVPWQNERGSTDFTAGPDGKIIYFQSGRPTSPDDAKRESNIWRVEWTGEDWAEPVPLPPPANSEEHLELYPSVTPDGSVYYFTDSRPDSRIGDIYRSRFVDDKYQEAERLEDPINSDYYEVDPFVAPDGSYFLFGSSRPGGYSLIDLYIVFRRDDGSWTHPFNAGAKLNPFCVPIRMSVTPDGKYFFFPSIHETKIPKGEKVESPHIEKWGDNDIYWVGTDFIDDLKEQYMNKVCAAEKFEKEYREHGLPSALAQLKGLYSAERDIHYFELSEYLVLCGKMMREGSFDDAEKLYDALLRVFPEEFRIKQGYAAACMINGRTSRGLGLMKELWTQFPTSRSAELWIVTYQLRIESRKEDELAVLQFITREFPDSPYAFFNLAEAYEHYGDIEQAVLNCRKALELKADFVDAVDMLKRLE